MTGEAQAVEGVVTREELYERVWVTPINHLAAEYGVSGSYLIRVCAALNVPRPRVGHWQKKAVGKGKPRPPLPEALPGEQKSWSRETPLAKPMPRAVRSVRIRTRKERSVMPAVHPIIRGTEALFRRTRKIDDYEFLRPYKLLLPDIVTSEACLAQALDLGNSLYMALEQKGHRVMFGPTDRPMWRAKIDERETPKTDRKCGRYSYGTIWSPHRPTVTYVGAVPIGLAITEMTERLSLRYIDGKHYREDSDKVRKAKAWQVANSWTHEQDVPTGRFRVVAYSPRRAVDWRASWQDDPKRSLPAMIPEIVSALEQIAPDLERKEREAHEAEAQRQREWELERERWRREDDARQFNLAVAESQKQLSEIIRQWSAAMSIEQFFREAERQLELIAQDRRSRLNDRLALARSMVGTLDPLDFLEAWVAPAERYQRKYSEN